MTAMTRLLSFAVFVLACDKGGADASSAPAGSDAQAAPAARAEPIAFGELPLAVGMQREKQQALLMQITMHIDVGGQQVTAPFSSAEVEKKREEILELAGSKVTKLLVSYETMESRKVDGEGESVEASPVAGKSYIVTVKGEAVAATRKGKGKTSKAEREVVEKDYRRLGEDDKVCRRLRETRPAIGDVIEFKGSEFRGMGDGEGSVTLRLRELTQQGDRETARFDAKMSMAGPIDDGALTLDLSGALMVDVQTCTSGWFEAEGPLGLTATGTAKDGTKLTMKGVGQARFSATETLWHAP